MKYIIHEHALSDGTSVFNVLKKNIFGYGTIATCPTLEKAIKVLPSGASYIIE